MQGQSRMCPAPRAKALDACPTPCLQLVRRIMFAVCPHRFQLYADRGAVLHSVPNLRRHSKKFKLVENNSQIH
jgi:hypothetical protein